MGPVVPRENSMYIFFSSNYEKKLIQIDISSDTVLFFIGKKMD